MYSKHLISVVPLLLSLAACSSDPESNPGSNGGSAGAASGGKTGSGGATSGGASSGGASTGGAASGGASAGGTTSSQGGSNKGGDTSSTKGGAGPGSGGSSASGGSSQGGSSASGGSSQGGRTGSSGGSTGSGGGNNAAGGMTGSAGGGSTATFKCDNLSLKPSTTGVAKPSGAAGGLKVLDWAGFKGAVSYTFDDNMPTQMTNYSKLKASGGHVTWFVIGNSVGTDYKQTLADGQEIANHTMTHPSNVPGNPTSEVQQAQDAIKTKFGVTAASMAAPNCKPEWQPGGKGIVFFNRADCSKSAPALSPRDGTDPFKVPAYMPDESNDATATQSQLTGQHTAGKWRIFVIHGFDGGGGWQPISSTGTAAAMTDGVKNGFWVEGMTNVGAYWQGQKLISASATTSATWTLPAQFPKNMCVRITTTGGTVTQKGETIPWDDHGYYEISLDAGEVTVK